MVVLSLKALCDSDVFYSIMGKFNVPNTRQIMTDLKQIMLYLIQNDVHKLSMILRSYLTCNRVVHDRIAQLVVYISIYESNDIYTVHDLIAYTKQHTQSNLVIPREQIYRKQYNNIIKHIKRTHRIAHECMSGILCKHTIGSILKYTTGNLL